MAHAETAINRQDCPSDVGGVWAGKKYHGASDFVCRCHSGKRNGVRYLIKLVLSESRCHVCFDWAWSHNIHGDAS
jgi:hypothetical protein